MLVAIVAATLLAPPPDLPKLSPAAAKALDALQGDWKVVELTLNGMTVEPDVADEFVLTFKGRKFIFSVNGTPNQDGDVYALDPSTNPACIDFSRKIEKTRVEEGVYKIDGDTLLYHSYKGKDKNRPAGFDVPKDETSMLVKAKRIKK